MSAQRVGSKLLRRIQRETDLGEAVVRAWSFGGYTMHFVVLDVNHPDNHWHGWWNKPTGKWERADIREAHFDTCRQLKENGRYDNEK